MIVQVKNPTPEQKNTSRDVLSSSRESSKQKTYKMSETVNVGYTSYRVWNAWWDNKSSDNQFINQKPSANYLFIDLTIRNDDREARNIPPIKLIDIDGREYETAVLIGVENAMGVLDSLNPTVEKRGIIVFDVPRNREYKLLVSGGYWTSEASVIDIEIN